MDLGVGGHGKETAHEKQSTGGNDHHTCNRVIVKYTQLWK
jgi:hypothetical protein